MGNQNFSSSMTEKKNMKMVEINNFELLGLDKVIDED